MVFFKKKKNALKEKENVRTGLGIDCAVIWQSQRGNNFSQGEWRRRKGDAKQVRTEQGFVVS